MEMVVVPNMDFVKKGVLFRFATKLGSGLGGVLARRHMSRNSTLSVIITGVVGTPQMVFTNSITINHVNMIANWPLMNSMAIGGYKNANAMNPTRGYQKPFTVIA